MKVNLNKASFQQLAMVLFMLLNHAIAAETNVVETDNVGMNQLETKATETLKVCYDQWPPMTIFPNAQEPRRGVVIDMFADIYQKAGISLSFFEVPYARGLAMVQEGLCDVLPEKEFSPLEDAGYVYANEETFRYPTAFVIRRDDPWQYQGIQSLKDKRVATGSGWNYSSMSEDYQHFLDDPENKDNVEIVSGEYDVVDRIMLMMVQGRVDLYADNLFVLQYLLKLNGLTEILKVVKPGLEHSLIEKPIFSSTLAPERRTRLIEIWDSGRKRITSEEMTALLARYGIEKASIDSANETY